MLKRVVHVFTNLNDDEYDHGLVFDYNKIVVKDIQQFEVTIMFYSLSIHIKIGCDIN